MSLAAPRRRGHVKCLSPLAVCAIGNNTSHSLDAVVRIVVKEIGTWQGWAGAHPACTNRGSGYLGLQRGWFACSPIGLLGGVCAVG